ncbi:uncharacterized protein LOC114723949 [Neltuma alba]|uniref:uncharacterized protein LOC114723949 n=1 Tax=Neltuma alba TaxID=207710 RepID=UPI0010A36272|nr:uncharacterized protein LOC114723949 [Prosopis alba]
MPASNPSSGPNSIYIIACILLTCQLAGGACLASYLLLPESENSSSLAIAGVALVCLPWVFWTFTFLYRILSRTFGFRLGTGGAGCGGGNFPNVPKNANSGSGEGTDQGGPNGLKRALSVASHESEMPLNIWSHGWHATYDAFTVAHRLEDGPALNP